MSLRRTISDTFTTFSGVLSNLSVSWLSNDFAKAFLLASIISIVGLLPFLVYGDPKDQKFHVFQNNVLAGTVVSTNAPDDEELTVSFGIQNGAAAAKFLIGGLIGLGINETEAKQIEEDLKSGSVLVAVEAKGDEKDRVKEVFKNAKKREKEQLDRATA